MYMILRKIKSEYDLTEKQRKEIIRIVNKARRGCLDFMLKQEHLVGGKIIKDGNCGPRAISEHLYGHQNRHKKVRANIVRLLKKKFSNYGKRMIKDGYLFTHRELYTAS
jgi:hypothetical protein